MNKKGNSAVFAIWLIAIVVIGGAGYGVYWLVQNSDQVITDEEPTGGTSAAGDPATFKVSVRDNSDIKTRYAGTGYCWDTKNPDALISGGSYTLSASAGTTIAPVTVGQTIRCVAFDSTHHGMPDQKYVSTQGAELTLESMNITATATNWQFQYYEDGSLEAPGSLSISAGNFDSFSRLNVKSLANNLGYNFKEVCFGSNNTASEIQLIEVDGVSAIGSRPYALRHTADFCMQWDNAVFLGDGAEMDLKNIKVTTTDSFVATENVTVTFLDEGYFEKAAGGIDLDVETDSTTPSDVGAANLVTTFLVVPS